MTGKQILDLMREVQEYRFFIRIADSVDVAEWLQLVDCIREAYQQAKREGLHAVAAQLYMLYGEALKMDVEGLDDLDYIA